ncbi:Uncharacterised protein [Vibrio cholerae]|nr:Uncharacterised protein [Vibrio cholerae]
MFLASNSVKYLTVFTFSSWVDGSSHTITALGCSCSAETVHRWFTLPSTAACSASALLWPVTRIMISCASSRVPTPIVSAYLGT